MTIKNNFRRGYSITAILFGILGVIVLFGFFQINSKTEEIHEDKIKTMFLVNSMYEEVLESIPSVYEFAVASEAATKADFEEKMTSYDKFEAEFKQMAKIGHTGEDPKEAEMLTNLHNAKVDYQKSTEDLFAVYEQKHKLERKDFDLLTAKMDKMHSLMDELFTLRKQKIEIASDEISKLVKDIIIVIIAIAFLVGVIAGGIAFYMWHSISNPLESLQISVRAIAGGDLSQRARVLGRNEVSDLASNFNAMADKIAESQEKMGEVNTSLEEQSNKLKDQLEQLRKFQRITIDREMKMVELKDKLKECENNHGKK